MALIVMERYERQNKDNNRVHKEVDATYTDFFEGGIRYFQIDTYGTDNREFRGKVSQSIQMSEETFREMLKAMGIK